MSQKEDNDQYAVYTGIEDGAATLSLYDEGGVVTQFTMSPEDLPEGTEYQDHFWVERDEDGEITELNFDPEFTEEKLEEYQEAEEVFRQMQERGRQELNEDNEHT